MASYVRLLGLGNQKLALSQLFLTPKRRHIPSQEQMPEPTWVDYDQVPEV